MSIVEDLNREWEEFMENQISINKEGPVIKEAQAELFEKQTSIKSKVAKQSKAARVLAAMIAKCDAEDPSVKEKKDLLDKYSAYNSDLNNILPNSGGWFVERYLGKVNNVVLSGRPTRRIAFKQEYEAFKYRWTFVSVPLSFVLLFIDSRVLDTLFQLLLIYFYLTLALRENILKANGSRIPKWWIFHHYVSMLLLIVQLTWPYSPSYAAFRPQFYLYAAYTGIVQILQYKYQISRLYALTSLGKANVMDVASSDSSQVIIFKNFLLLLPFVYLSHVAQIYHAGTCLYLWYQNNFSIFEWQVPVLAVIWAFVGCGNALTTSQAWRKKFLASRQKKTH